MQACRRQGEPEFEQELREKPVDTGGDEDGLDADEDPVLEDAIRLVAPRRAVITQSRPASLAA